MLYGHVFILDIFLFFSYSHMLTGTTDENYPARLNLAYSHDELFK